jgi:hypothetical protein
MIGFPATLPLHDLPSVLGAPVIHPLHAPRKLIIQESIIPVRSG